MSEYHRYQSIGLSLDKFSWIRCSKQLDFIFANALVWLAGWNENLKNNGSDSQWPWNGCCSFVWSMNTARLIKYAIITKHYSQRRCFHSLHRIVYSLNFQSIHTHKIKCTSGQTEKKHLYSFFIMSDLLERWFTFIIFLGVSTHYSSE